MHKSWWVKRRSMITIIITVLEKCLLLGLLVESMGQVHLIVVELMNLMRLKWSPHLVELILNVGDGLKVLIVYAGQLLIHHTHLVIWTNFRFWVVLKVHDGVTGRVVAINDDLLVIRLLYNLKVSLVLRLTF